MDALHLLEEAGEVTPADATVIEGAVELVRAAALAEDSSSSHPSSAARHRWTRVAVGGTALIGAAAAIILVSAVFPTHVAPDRGSRKLLTASEVGLISSRTMAVADSGTATEVLTSPPGLVTQGVPNTTDVTFSGQNVNYLITTDGRGARAAQDRVVDGQLYVYVEGPDLQMRWYHDTSPDAAASLSFPDPRTLFRTISSSAGFEDVGRERVGDVELTHLRASTPAAIGTLHIPGVGQTLAGLDLWVNGDDVVHKVVVSSTVGSTSCPTLFPHDTGSSPRATVPTGQPASHYRASPALEPLFPHRCTSTALTITTEFANLGTPETITAPSGAIDKRLLG